MRNTKSETYQSYRREFKRLRHEGCILCYPEDEEMKPGQLAEMIACDKKATYMRDTFYNEKGGPEQINFHRIIL